MPVTAMHEIYLLRLAADVSISTFKQRISAQEKRHNTVDVRCEIDGSLTGVPDWLPALPRHCPSYSMIAK